jgi:hypothetical protein
MGRLSRFTDIILPPRLPAGQPKLALAKKRAAMDTEKIECIHMHDIFEKAPAQADLQPK